MTIGGYFELELPKQKEYHSDALRLNTGRNAFEYILQAKKYKNVYLPYYTCDVMLEPITKLNLTYEFYHIDNNFNPIFDFTRIKKDETFVYNNYFGICDKQVQVLAAQCKNLIVDNSQAFFSKPIPNIDTFYSPRKFFGLPDGAYLYTNKQFGEKLEKDVSLQRMEHLMGRIELGAEEFYNVFKRNNAALKKQPIKEMSNLTHRLLQSIDYTTIAKKRRENFLFLNETLCKSNRLKINFDSEQVPMVYPYLINDGNDLKSKLIEQKIFIPTYWPNEKSWKNIKNSFDYFLKLNLIPVPIDQRYSSKQMKIILQNLKF